MRNSILILLTILLCPFKANASEYSEEIQNPLKRVARPQSIDLSDLDKIDLLESQLRSLTSRLNDKDLELAQAKRDTSRARIELNTARDMIQKLENDLYIAHESNLRLSQQLDRSRASLSEQLSRNVDLDNENMQLKAELRFAQSKRHKPNISVQSSPVKQRQPKQPQKKGRTYKTQLVLEKIK